MFFNSKKAVAENEVCNIKVKVTYFIILIKLLQVPFILMLPTQLDHVERNRFFRSSFRNCYLSFPFEN